MITIIDPNNAVDRKREQELQTIFQEFGYTYVPGHALAEPYPGPGYTTWFDRFFS